MRIWRGLPLGSLPARSSYLKKCAQNTLKTSWPSVKMTVFEYIPFVGLSKIIDPSGKVTEYQYNASGKLKGIKDGNNQLHNEYFYSPDNKL